MSEPFIGEVRIFGCNFAPSGWAACDGQLIPINQNTALFSLLGINYGGNGISNFALPDLRDRVALGTGQGPGLTDRQPGDTGGSAAVTLLASQLSPHDHGLRAAPAPASTSPVQAALAPTVTGAAAYHAPGVLVPMAASALSPTGGSQPHENRQPALALNFCIALQGIYPPRS